VSVSVRREGFRLNLRFIQLVNGTKTSVYCLDLLLMLIHILVFARTLPLFENPSLTWGPRVILGVLGVAFFAAVAEFP
jgi:hypothetical protein